MLVFMAPPGSRAKKRLLSFLRWSPFNVGFGPCCREAKVKCLALSTVAFYLNKNNHNMLGATVTYQTQTALLFYLQITENMFGLFVCLFCIKA